MDLQVQKKDGTLQPFDRSKVSAGIVRSGASLEEAENVTNQAVAWAQNVAQNGVIGTAELRAKVVEILKTVNMAAGTAYESYQKPVAPVQETPLTEAPVAEAPNSGTPTEEPQV